MRKMKNEIITNESYMSEIMHELPNETLLNKGVTGCGGTTVELLSKRNSIILVPTIELAKNKWRKNYLIVHGSIKNKEIEDYINSDVKYKKIIGTYDCLKRLLDINSDVKNYFLLIDEYHILFSAYSYRNIPIQYLLKNFRLFKGFCFIKSFLKRPFETYLYHILK